MATERVDLLRQSLERFLELIDAKATCVYTHCLTSVPRTSP